MKNLKKISIGKKKQRKSHFPYIKGEYNPLFVEPEDANIEELKQSQETEEDIHSTLNPIGERLEAISRQIKQAGYRGELINRVARKELTKDEALKEIIDISNEVSGFLVEDEIDDNLAKEILNVKNKVEEFKKNLNSDLQLIENEEQFLKVPTNVRASVITSLNLLDQTPDKEEHPENKIAEIEENINEISEILENNNNNDVTETLLLLNTRLEEYKKDLGNELQRRENENLINNLSDGKTKERLKYISDLIDNKGYKQIIIDKAEKGELGRYEIKKHIQSKIDALIKFSETCETYQPEEVWEAVTSLKNRLELLEKDIFKELKLLDEARILKEKTDSSSNRGYINFQIDTIADSLNPLDMICRINRAKTQMQISKEDAKQHVLEDFVRPEFHRMTELYYRHRMLFKHNEQQKQEEIFDKIAQDIDIISNTDTEINSYLIGQPKYKYQQELQKQNILLEKADYNFLRRNDNVKFNSNTIDGYQGASADTESKLSISESLEIQATNEQSGSEVGKFIKPNINKPIPGVDLKDYYSSQLLKKLNINTELKVDSDPKTKTKGEADTKLERGLFSDDSDNESINEDKNPMPAVETSAKIDNLSPVTSANQNPTTNSQSGYKDGEDYIYRFYPNREERNPDVDYSNFFTIDRPNYRNDDNNKVGPDKKVGSNNKVLEQYNLDSRNFQQQEEEKRKAKQEKQTKSRTACHS